jgi:hypothetical protein
MRLHQVNAVLQGRKAEANRAFDTALKTLQADKGRFKGLTRTYKPRAEDGEQFPPERTMVQLRADSLIADMRAAFTTLMDAELTQDTANTKAKADIVVGGRVIARDVPVTNLLRLDHLLTDVRTFFAALPVPDPAEQWHQDAGLGLLVTAPSMTTRDRKVPRNHVKAPATDKFAEQVEVYWEPHVVGDWTLIQMSGAVSPERKRVLLQRLSDLQAAVRLAREQANTLEAAEEHIGAALFDMLLA